MSQDCFTSRFGHLESLDGKPEQAIAFNGTTSRIHGTFNTSVVFNQKSYPIAIKVVEASNYEFILGTDFLNKFKAIINLRDGILEIDGCAPIQIAKQEIDVNEPPVLHCASDVSVPPQSVVYLACNRVGAVSRKVTAMCLAETCSFANGTGLLLANGIINPQSKIFVKVVNVTDVPVQVRNGTKISSLAECEELPYAISKTIPTNSLKPMDLKTLELDELGTDVSFLSKSESTQLQLLVGNYQHLFANEKDNPGRTNLVEHHIDLVERSRPFKHSSRRFPIHLQDEANKEVQKMLDAGIVEPSTTEFSSSPVLVRKKDGSIRFCVDYRKLNQATIKDSYPLPRINEVIDSIGRDAKYFTTLDLAMGYHHVQIAEEDKPKTAFLSRYGLLQYTAMPFGLTNAPATFQRLMERVLAHMNWKDCLVYIDDVLIWSKTFQEHLEKLQSVFRAFEKAGLRIKTKKCHICCKTVPYLGHLLSESGIQMDPQRIKAIVEMRPPSQKKEVQVFLGMINYYRRFIPNLSRVEAPIRKLVSATHFTWPKEADVAFGVIKNLVCQNTILAYPARGAKLAVDTDASDDGLGAVISQIDSNGIEQPIAFASRTLSECEKKWTVMERECLAIVWALTDQFHCYVYGTSFTVRTDNRFLKWLQTLRKPTPRIARWILKLQEYDYQIVHRPGSTNRVADALSRIPVNAVFLRNEKSIEELREIQRSDTDLQPVIDNLVSGNEPDRDIKLSDHAWQFLRRIDELEIFDGILVRLVNRNGNESKQVIVSRSMKQEILSAFHDDPTGGHLSRDKMLGKIRDRYFWIGQTDDVKRYCKCCMECQKLKPQQSTPEAPLQPISSSRAFEMVSMDVCGPYPDSERNNRYILVITDHFTKWVEAYPMFNQETKTIAFCLEQFVNTFGYPDIILTDQGRNFESFLIKEMCVRLKIEKRTTSAYHPQCNGQTERFNRTMNNMLAQYVDKNQTDWDLWLPSVLFAYRTAVHSSTGHSPYEMVFGRLPKQPIDFKIPSIQASSKAITTPKYFSALRETLEAVHDEARDNLRAAQTAQKAYYDRQENAEKFSVGDRVLVYDPVSRGFPKFQKHFVGPYMVAAKPIAGGVTYILRACDTGTIIHLHRNRLKKCQVSFPEHESIDVIVDNEETVPPMPNNPVPPEIDVLPHEPVVAVPDAVDVPLPVVPAPQAAYGQQQVRREAGDRPRRDVRPPDRLADRYTPALAEKPRKKK